MEQDTAGYCALSTKYIIVGGIEKLCKADIIVFVRSVFLQGLFFKDPENLPQGILQKAAEPLRQIRNIAQAEGISVANLAISFIRDLEGVSSLVLGSETPKQVLQNIELVKSPPLSKDIRSKIMSMFDYIDQRIIMPWTWNG